MIVFICASCKRLKNDEESQTVELETSIRTHFFKVCNSCYGELRRNTGTEKIQASE